MLRDAHEKTAYTCSSSDRSREKRIFEADVDADVGRTGESIDSRRLRELNIHSRCHIVRDVM